MDVLSRFPLAVPWDDPPSALHPRGPEAAEIASLWWMLLAGATAVTLLVFALLFLALRRREPARLPGGDNGFLVTLGIALPAVVLAGVMGLTLAVGADDGGQADLTVVVEGHQFWWEVHYPEADVVTANELHIPAGVPVEVVLRSDDVIHSFWVPQLAGKTDLIPGRETRMEFQADRPGTYWGECAEFCGIQHARMQFVVVAEPAREFRRWLAGQASPAPSPRSALAAEGLEVFLSASCAACHTIRGVADSGDAAPDLTHLASRLTLGAGTLENTEGHLAGWILDPQSLKPGVRMPPTSLSGPELQALLAYLDTLE